MTQTVTWPEFVDTGARVEHERMTLMEQVHDPFTLQHLNRLGVSAGWKCLEVGAGGGSVARAMAARCGPHNVTATDLSLRLLTPLRDLGITVLRHDVTVDPAPGEFDLIHCRFVVDHLPQRQHAINRMASWLKPGGWLLVEAGTTAPELSCHPEVRRAMQASNSVLSQALGTHTSWARTLPLPLEAAGLVGCGAEGTALPVRGGSAMGRWLRATYRLIDERAVASGNITLEELNLGYSHYDDPAFVDYTWLTVAAWGRKV